MEYGLGRYAHKIPDRTRSVLILVLMEYGLGHRSAIFAMAWSFIKS